jgi:hypothetical protein
MGGAEPAARVFMRLENTAPDEKLDDLLREWKIEESLPPRFDEGVWQRVARQEDRRTTTMLDRLSGWVGLLLARPSVAVSYVALLLMVGLAAGYWQARSTEARTDERLGARYVQMLDPYQSQSQSR